MTCIFVISGPRTPPTPLNPRCGTFSLLPPCADSHIPTHSLKSSEASASCTPSLCPHPNADIHLAPMPEDSGKLSVICAATCHILCTNVKTNINNFVQHLNWH